MVIIVVYSIFRLEVQKGEVYGFLGPNGAGKTTAIRHIMGFSRPQKGLTFVNGLNSWENASEIQKFLGYLAWRNCLSGKSDMESSLLE